MTGVAIVSLRGRRALGSCSIQSRHGCSLWYDTPYAERIIHTGKLEIHGRCCREDDESLISDAWMQNKNLSGSQDEVLALVRNIMLTLSTLPKKKKKKI